GTGIRVFSAATIIDSIIWNNDIYGTSPEITYSDVEGGFPGEGNIDADPCFVIGPTGDYYLSQIAAGQGSKSPCVDAGSDTAANLELDLFTTRTDQVSDEGVVDMGYHYPAVVLVEGELLLVPSQYPTIQAAIEVAVNGNTVIIAPGTYTGAGNRDIDFLGKAITVRSTDPEDPCVVAATVIDCQGSQADPHRGFYFHSGEGPDSVIAGLTITDGYVHEQPALGGGIRCTGASPTIENCIITGCTAWGVGGLGANRRAYGGGIFCDSGSNPAITNCQITGNKARGGNGGQYWDPETGDTHAYPGGSAFGGGIYCHSAGGVVIENCIINNNAAAGGAGVYGDLPREEAAPGGGLGGGIYGIVSISNSVVAGNKVILGDGPWWISDDHLYGGGIFCSSDSVITNCLLVNNRGLTDIYFYGAAIYCQPGSAVEIKNCTLTMGGYIYNRMVESTGPAEITVTNSIFWGYDPRDVGTGVTVTYSLLGQDVNGPGNIIGADPCFVSGPLGNYHLSQVAAGQVFESPCVDAGSDTAARLGLDQCTTRTDGAGDEAIVDMGYHYGNCGPALPAGDIDEDGDVDGDDYALFAAGWYCREPNMIAKGTAVVDGVLDEWSADVGWLELDKVYYGSPNDVNEAWFSLRWSPDANKLYAAVIARDSNHVFSDEYISWNASDRLEIYTQGDAEGGTGWVGDYNVAQQYMVGPNTAGGSWA
ncbi:MAG: right-handed parallel beta-helix repeat-containing protein, partial [Planctomycetota bacterium]